MFKTIIMIIGVLLAMLFFGIAIRQVIESLQKDEAVLLTSLATQTELDRVLVQWETSEDTTGQVIYSMNGTTLIERDDGFSRFHSVLIKDLQGHVQFYAVSCTATGACVRSENMSGNFSIRQCSDETQWGRCSISIPLKCIEGALIDMCRDCGCPFGLACISNGSCMNRT